MLLVIFLTIIAATTSLAGCTPERGAPISISIGYGHPDPKERTWAWSSESTDFRIDSIAWNNAVVELHVCESHEWSALLVPSAEAHVSGSTTRLGTPMLEVFSEAITGLRVVGELGPDANTFCRGYLIVAPADDDVMNLSNVETETMIGKSFQMTGAYREIPSGEWIPFEISTDAFFAFEFELKNPKNANEKLAVESGQTAIIGIDKSVPDLAPFIGSPDALNDPRLANRIVEAIGATVSMRTF